MKNTKYKLSEGFDQTSELLNKWSWIVDNLSEVNPTSYESLYWLTYELPSEEILEKMLDEGLEELMQAGLVVTLVPFEKT
jgi:DNA-binding HxlR family transcriptional regulator